MVKCVISAITKIIPAFTLGIMVSRMANEISNASNVSDTFMNICLLVLIIGCSIAYDILSRREKGV